MNENIKKVNEVLEDFYKLFFKTEDMALKRGIKCLTHTELHLIEAIGQDSLTMNELAEKIGITMGTATVAVSKLTEKGFIARVRSNSDRRKVFVSLTPKGSKALAYHNNYHKMIMSTLTEDIADKDLTHFIEVFEVILNALRGKTDYFKPLLITEFPVGTKVSVVEIKGTPIVQNFFASHGIENFTVLEIMESNDKDNFILKKADGDLLVLDILDAKNLIGIKNE
ncbi:MULTISPECIES: MarR family winged helix-turn-helix transcriptional regulator [Fusobacterium]|jgi:DNA-binding MarR family transcriptional regulator|uniref:MarR family transcriptional regulator n=1 Tax=Fusobacterium varium ATCC 27725 TaxID=469618 RepID=A0ABN5JJA0_FUSVA|nr:MULTISPECIES: MarR family transcriptional regulator [Fusobacterium]AVQ32369.1 MarR family transcriptional regulator [Fusobacterium varium ATCC 27725]EES64305.1 transcriptional regulator, MarR family [Fusobacterium varium ATCC 27725]MCF0169385.1 MarR family transcriptional regulator [Fusobacterium varium]MCF2674406.1 MarR family transcriptional regulator [Fusobacterium varium]MCI6032482.1 MarR family transcriptional regulator [Fusobacterium varium]